MKKFLLILLLLSSCSASHKRQTSGTPHFFACKNWTDLNHDGRYDYNEFDDIKSAFHSTEQVLFIGFFYDLPLGSNLRFRLFAPDGSIVKEVSQPLLYNGTLVHLEYSVSDLISEKSTGVWEGVWDVEDDVVAEVDVNFVH